MATYVYLLATQQPNTVSDCVDQWREFVRMEDLLRKLEEDWPEWRGRLKGLGLAGEFKRKADVPQTWETR